MIMTVSQEKNTGKSFYPAIGLFFVIINGLK
jgi:hypothetical protein